jgi:hypothetical protein
LLEEYSDIDETISPEVLELIVGFVKDTHISTP